MSNKIHIAGAGGVAGINMTRCLADQGYYLQGHDSSPWGTMAMECKDEIEPESTSVFFVDMVIPIADGLVKKWAGSDLCFLPSREVVEVCQDKAKTAELLGELAPATYWVRDTHGAGGSGAQMASEFLPGRNYSVELLYNKGKLLAYFMKERLAYDIKGRKDPLWQRGSSVVSICIDEPKLLELAKTAVFRVCSFPETVKGLYHGDDSIKMTVREKDFHGVFSVDFKENEKGEPKVTEINPGRFLTASYSFFEKFYNLPLLMVKTFFNEPYELGAYPKGWLVIRQQDSRPKFFESPDWVNKHWDSLEGNWVKDE